MRAMEGEMKKIIPVFICMFFLASFCLYGQIWSPPKRMTWNSGLSSAPYIIVDSNNHLHVVWHDTSLGNQEIYYKRSTDGGATWSVVKRLTWNSGYSYYPHMAVDSYNHVHVVWYDDTPPNWVIMYKKSTDGGATWKALKWLTWTNGDLASSDPTIAVDSNDILHLVWEEDNYPYFRDLMYKKSTDGGANWSAKKRLTWNSGASTSPYLIVDSNDYLHVVWQDQAQTAGEYEIYYKNSQDGGMTWSVPKRLTWNADASWNPKIAAGPGNELFVCWENSLSGLFEVFVMKSTNSGASWSALKRLTWNSVQSRFPFIAVDSSSNPYIVWEQGTYCDFDIYYKQSADGGGSWSMSTRLTWTSLWTVNSVLAIDSNDDLHLVWISNITGNYELYYKNRK